ncbi:MAG: hypothetical protein ACRDSH_18650 [Pseudonocardiaceae bacterium]
MSEQIQLRVDRQIERAVKDGCMEIHVLAHSLGSVIAARTLLSQQAPNQVDTLVTTGSPIAKVMHLWSGVISEPQAGVLPFRWLNFYDRLDPIGGGVDSVIRGRRVKETGFVGWGGVTASHGAYERNNLFLSHMGALLGSETNIRVPAKSRLMELIRALAIDLAFAGVVVGSFVLGVTIFAALGAVFGVIYSMASAGQSESSPIPYLTSPPVTPHGTSGWINDLVGGPLVWTCVVGVAAMFVIVILLTLAIAVIAHPGGPAGERWIVRRAAEVLAGVMFVNYPPTLQEHIDRIGDSEIGALLRAWWIYGMGLLLLVGVYACFAGRWSVAEQLWRLAIVISVLYLGLSAILGVVIKWFEIPPR